MVANRGPTTSGVTIALLVVATVFVAARFYSRGVLVKSIKQDDWWILAAWLCSVGFSAAICVGVSDGLGMHWADIVAPTRDDFRRAQYAYSILYNPCLMLTKNSIIVFYLSVMSKDVDPVFRWCNWITLAIVNVAGTALTCLNIFQCQPISAAYSWPGPTSPQCTDIVTLYLSSAPVNIITDIALLLLPMPILTGLRLPKKQKIILVVTFSAGIFVAVVDVVRIAYLQSAALDRLTVANPGQSGKPRIIETTDFSWYAALSFMWSAIEVNVGIVCACVPSLKPLFLKFAPNFIKDSDDVSPMSSIDVVAEKKNEPLSTMNTDMTVLTHPAAFRKPAIQEYDGDDDGDYMGFLNMLSSPDEEAPRSGVARNATSMSRISRTTTAGSAASEFGFVKMDKSRNMLKINNRQSLWPVAVVTFIFFLWGFAYGLLDVLNAQFQTIAGLSSGEALGLHGAYYAGYFVGPLTLGRFMLKRYGFKSSMIAGLCVYGCGTLVFWPSAVLTSYGAFIVSNFIVGFGLSCLEVAANPYIALCGPLEYAEVRLNFSQAFQAVGTVCSPLLARRVLFRDVLNAPSLINVQWAYLGISLFDFALAIIFYYIPLPEATEEQLEEQANKRSAVYRTRIGPFRIVWVTLALGVFSQFCYVGAQEGNGGSTGSLLTSFVSSRGSLDAVDFETIGHITFAVGRFLGSFLNYLVKPRWILMGCFVGVIILSAVQMSATGASAIATNNLIYFFEGSIFPIIYAISMRGMGDQTFNAAALMTTAISSGAIIPPIIWAVTNSHGVRYSYSVVLAVFVFGAVFPVYLNLVPAAKKQTDPIHEKRDRRRQTRRALRTNSMFSEGARSEATEKKFGIAGIIARRKKNHEKHLSGTSHTAPFGTSEHVERRSQRDWAESPTSPTNIKSTSSKLWDDERSDSLHSLPSQPSPTRTRTRSISRRKSVSIAEPGGRYDDVPSFAPWMHGTASALDDGRHDDERGYGYDEDEIMASGGSGEGSSGSGRGSANSGDALDSLPPQERRAWTDEDDIRMDYHEALRGL
ncbi:hypothetical protein PMZ80_000606 [Knufia obscura]|uniref:Rhodopsin domain-containing protein n=1 Tax=Knufia obscura TaxID=1635080 RepID=A0ABR0S1T1_9EURO|nr:hypothetical protein PMZ80_000606 [Knufia obscura]